MEKKKEHRLLIGATLATVLATPLLFDGGISLERAVAKRLESLVSPSAMAAVIAPASAVKTSLPASPEQFDAARLLMAGTMLFGLAAVVRRSI